MPFRFRRSARFGPLRFHFTGKGLSSLSIGGRGASLNLPIGRQGGPHTTLGVPGTGISWSVEHTPDSPALAQGGTATGLPNSRRLRPHQLGQLQECCLALLHQQIFASGRAAHPIWERALVSRLLGDGSLGARDAGLLAVIETPQAMEAYIRRARSQDDARRRANRCIEAAQEALRRARANTWL